MDTKPIEVLTRKIEDILNETKDYWTRHFSRMFNGKYTITRADINLDTREVDIEFIDDGFKNEVVFKLWDYDGYTDSSVWRINTRSEAGVEKAKVLLSYITLLYEYNEKISSEK